MALHLTWFLGLVFIGLSLYATQLLSVPRQEERGQAGKYGSRDSPNITFFTAPRPFEGLQGERQYLALHSWLRLSPHVQVVLLGYHPSLQSVAMQLSPQVKVNSDVDFTFLGTPFFHNMVARASNSNSDIVVLIDPEFVLLEDFMVALEYTHSYLQHDWLMVAKPKKVDDFPFHLEATKSFWLDVMNQTLDEEQVRNYVREHGVWGGCESRFVWVWNRAATPLHVGVMPPFVYGKGFHNQWLLNEASASGVRLVFDATDAISLFYFENFVETFEEKEKNLLAWEVEKNAGLASLYGSFSFRPKRFVDVPTNLVWCGDSSSRKKKVFRFVNAEETEFEFDARFRRYALETRHHVGPTRYPCPRIEMATDKSLWADLKGRLTGRRKMSCKCDNGTEGRALGCLDLRLKMPFKPNSSLSSSVPWSLKELLEKVADNSKTVVLAVVGNNYRDMLMSWVCRLQKLNISNFLVGAIDTDVLKFSLSQGLPVFRVSTSVSVSFNDCHFGTKCFQKVTKTKSRTVLRILHLGYNVLFSDVDVYWFKSPLEYLKSFGPKTIAAQSDQWNETEPCNEPRRLNSGFYFAWSENATITVFEKIVKHGAKSRMSEQPSFYDILCGEGGRNRIGDTQCMEPETNVTVYFLDRAKFPNGAFRGLWEKKNVNKECLNQGCFVLHNNWLSGREKKLKRQIAARLWDYDTKHRFCSRSWQGLELNPIF